MGCDGICNTTQLHNKMMAACLSSVNMAVGPSLWLYKFSQMMTIHWNWWCVPHFQTKPNPHVTHVQALFKSPVDP